VAVFHWSNDLFLLPRDGFRLPAPRGPALALKAFGRLLPALPRCCEPRRSRAREGATRPGPGARGRVESVETQEIREAGGAAGVAGRGRRRFRNNIASVRRQGNEGMALTPPPPPLGVGVLVGPKAHQLISLASLIAVGSRTPISASRLFPSRFPHGTVCRALPVQRGLPDQACPVFFRQANLPPSDLPGRGRDDPPPGSSQGPGSGRAGRSIQGSAEPYSSVQCPGESYGFHPLSGAHRTPPPACSNAGTRGVPAPCLSNAGVVCQWSTSSVPTPSGADASDWSTKPSWTEHMAPLPTALWGCAPRMNASGVLGSWAASSGRGPGQAFSTAAPRSSSGAPASTESQPGTQPGSGGFSSSWRSGERRMRKSRLVRDPLSTHPPPTLVVQIGERPLVCPPSPSSSDW